MVTHDAPELEPRQNNAATANDPQRDHQPAEDNPPHEFESRLNGKRSIGSWLVSAAVVIWLGVLLLTIEPVNPSNPSDEMRTGSEEPMPRGMPRPNPAIGAAGIETASSPGIDLRRPGLIATTQRNAAPIFELPDIDGGTATLRDYTGQVLLLNFWATWCLPCRAEMPWFIDFQTAFRDEGFRVLGVSLDEPGWSAIRPFLERQPVNYLIALADTPERLLPFGLINILPTTWLIDRNGRIAAEHVGLVRRDEIEAEIDQLLNE